MVWMTTDEIEGEANDRAARQSIADFLSEPGGSSDVRESIGTSVQDEKPKRTRQLRPTFREPTTGFPGTKSFAPHSLDGRPPGATEPAARVGPDSAPAPAARSKHFAGWRPAVLEARGNTPVNGADEPADERGIRGWRAVSGERTSTAADERTSDPRGANSARTSAATVTAAADQPAAKRPGRPKKDKVAPGPKLPAAIAKLVPKSDAPSISKLTPTENERASATRLFREIGQRFNDNRKKSKTAAYAGFRHDLMDNLDTLVMGGAIDLKEATSIITNLEQYTKETEAESTETPATILGRWLRMDASEVAGLEVAAVEELVEESIVANEDDEENETSDESEDEPADV